MKGAGKVDLTFHRAHGDREALVSEGRALGRMRKCGFVGFRKGKGDEVQGSKESALEWKNERALLLAECGHDDFLSPFGAAGCWRWQLLDLLEAAGCWVEVRETYRSGPMGSVGDVVGMYFPCLGGGALHYGDRSRHMLGLSVFSVICPFELFYDLPHRPAHHLRQVWGTPPTSERGALL